MKRIYFLCWSFLFFIPTLSQAQYWNSNGSRIYYNTDNVGIGAGNPKSKLHVKGPYSLGNNYTLLAEGSNGHHGVIAVKGAYQTGSGSMTSNIQFTNANNNKYWAISSRNNWRHPNGSYEGYDLRYTFYNGSGWNTVLTMKDNGRVGIGTRTPNETLHLYTNTSSRRAMATYQTWNAKYGTYWKMGAEHGNGHTAGQFMLYRYDNQGNITIPMAVMVNGQVVLGTALKRENTSDPAVRVNGELCVSTGGACPDYVFEEDYERMSLSELKEFIKENKHLPGVKSAGEIEEQGGVHMVEISYSMLEKIEELTLYTLEQEDRLDQQAADLAEVKALLEKALATEN